MFSKHPFINYLLSVILGFLLLGAILFSLDLNYYISDRFYAPTSTSRVVDNYYHSMFVSLYIVILLVFPIVFILLTIDVIKGRKRWSIFLVFPILVAFLFTFIIVFGPGIRLVEKLIGELPSNNNIIMLQDIRVEPVDSNGNQVPDTLRVYLTLDGNSPQNIKPNGLTAFGGVNICIYIPPSSVKPLVCKHFFHPENESEISPERFRIGIKGIYTYIFSVETPIDSKVDQKNNTSHLRLTADFIGADNLLVNYDKIINNPIDFSYFENIGIHKLPNEQGLH